MLPPLAVYGVAIEAHAQNIVVRFCRQSGKLRGFAVRDCGGIQLHRPTLEGLGIQLPEFDAKSSVSSDNLKQVWSRFHHVFLQNHVASLLVALGLELRGGWAIVRDEIARVLDIHNPGGDRDVLQYLLDGEMPFRCFFTSRMEGVSPRTVSIIPYYHQPGFHIY